VETKELEIWERKFEDYFIAYPIDDGGHDISHLKRVWRLADKLSTSEEDKLTIMAACYFHDIVNYPKNDKRRSQSSKDSAIKAREILSKMSFPKEKLSQVAHCIESHSFSAGIKPETLEAQIVQDSDRMESLGAIGIARVFYTAGKMGSSLFCDKDPFAQNRDLDDHRYGVDHFKTKLLNLPETMNTNKGKIEAKRRAQILERFLADLKDEL
jgi:uncharacterized protein